MNIRSKERTVREGFKSVNRRSVGHLFFNNCPIFLFFLTLILSSVIPGCRTTPVNPDKPTVIDITDVYDSRGNHIFRKEYSQGKTTLVYRLYQKESFLNQNGIWLVTYRDQKIHNAFLKNTGENLDHRIDWNLKTQEPYVKITAHKKTIAKRVIGNYLQNYLAYYQKDIDYGCDGTVDVVHYLRYDVDLYGKDSKNKTENSDAFDIPLIEEKIDWGNDKSIDIIIDYQYSPELRRILKKETRLQKSAEKYKEEIVVQTGESPVNMTEFFKYDSNGNLIEETIDKNNDGKIDFRRLTNWKNLDLSSKNDGWLVDSVFEDIDGDGEFDIATRYGYKVLDFPVKNPSAAQIIELAEKY